MMLLQLTVKYKHGSCFLDLPIVANAEHENLVRGVGSHYTSNVEDGRRGYPIW